MTMEENELDSKIGKILSQEEIDIIAIWKLQHPKRRHDDERREHEREIFGRPER